MTVSSIGFLTKELNVKADMGTITLEVSNARLDEVLVIGYGTTTRRLSTGSTSQVSGRDLDKQPISNPIIGMEGRVPGVFITQSAGYAGAPVNVMIRGQNSLTGTVNNSTAPLYIIDGIPFGSTPVEQSVGGFGTTAFSPLNTIDPTQIESISVLKDADATAIYGSRGANGVILITTKKGRAGDTRVDVDISSGFGELAPLFTQNDTTGNPVSLKDFRGKYVLLDFWASWCGPCRAENPNYVKNYKIYHDKGFEMLGVSLDKQGDQQKWLDAIHKDGLLWQQLSDLQYWGNSVAKLYAITSIPRNFLIDPQGKIVAIDLRGEDLGKKLAEVLAN